MVLRSLFCLGSISSSFSSGTFLCTSVSDTFTTDIGPKTLA